MDTILRAIVVYWLLLFTLRVVGRRSMTQMTPFELILIFLLGGMSIQAVVSDDRSLTNAITGILSIGLMHVTVAWLKQRSPSFGRVVDGTPVVLFEKGEWHRQRMNHLRLQEQDVMASAREQGVERTEQIKLAVFERNGSVSILKQDEEQ